MSLQLSKSVSISPAQTNTKGLDWYPCTHPVLFCWWVKNRRLAEGKWASSVASALNSLFIGQGRQFHLKPSSLNYCVRGPLLLCRQGSDMISTRVRSSLGTVFLQQFLILRFGLSQFYILTQSYLIKKSQEEENRSSLMIDVFPIYRKNLQQFMFPDSGLQ
jgi:hypothetical protein